MIKIDSNFLYIYYFIHCLLFLNAQKKTRMNIQTPDLKFLLSAKDALLKREEEQGQGRSLTCDEGSYERYLDREIEKLMVLKREKTFPTNYPLLARLLSVKEEVVYHVDDQDPNEQPGNTYTKYVVAHFPGVFGKRSRNQVRDLYVHGNPEEKGFPSRKALEAQLEKACTDSYGNNHYAAVCASTCFF